MRTLCLLFAAAAGGSALLAVPARADAADLAGFTLAAEATPVAVQIFEPTIPVPAEPQLELNLSYARAKLSSGPTGRAVSSLMWPGDAVGYGLPELLQNPDATYPVKVDAAHPGGPADAKQEVAPGAAMTSHADGGTVEAAAHGAKHASPALPLPGLPISPVLVAMEGFSSRGKTAVTGDKATAVSHATAGTISLLGGLVKVDGLRADTEAVSDAVAVTGTYGTSRCSQSARRRGAGTGSGGCRSTVAAPASAINAGPAMKPVLASGDIDSAPVATRYA
jgi:hypothetical protein